MHQHAKTCKKKGHKICRFNFPLPPMQRSVILKLQDYNGQGNGHIELLEKKLQNINNQLDSMKYGVEISFDDF